MFIDYIENKTNRKEKDLNKLKNSEIPNVIYGIGSYAKDVLHLLKRYNIKLSMACVDAEFMLDDENTFQDLKVIALTEVPNFFSDFNLIIGFADYKKAGKKIRGLSKIKEIFFIDAPHHIDFFDYQYIYDNKDKLEFTYNLLEDKESKMLFCEFINSKISGEPYKLYPYNHSKQYFNELIELSSEESFVDCGAYYGDTIIPFLKKVENKFDSIYAFEPDRKNCEILRRNINNCNGLQNIQIIEKGCWSEPAVLGFKSDGGLSAFSETESDFFVEVESVDNIVGDSRVTFIKMDIEGSELQALYGASQTILRNKPKLAICVYHKPEDLITIPQYLYQLNPNYRFYLRHHQFISWECVLYAI